MISTAWAGESSTTSPLAAHDADMSTQSKALLPQGTQYQQVEISVSGTYQPSTVEVVRDLPVLLKLKRLDSGKCGEVFEIPDLDIKRVLPGHSTSEIVFTPHREGVFSFRCGMNMMHGNIKVSKPGLE
jgi:plastocyanin domain-containing protein